MALAKPCSRCDKAHSRGAAVPWGQRTHGDNAHSAELKATLEDPEAPRTHRSRQTSPNYRTEKHLAYPFTLRSEFSQAAIHSGMRQEIVLSGARDPPPLGNAGSPGEASRLAPPREQQEPLQSRLLKRTRLHSPLSAAPRKRGTNPWLSHLVRERAPQTSARSTWRGGEAHLEREVGSAAPEGGARPAPQLRRTTTGT